MKRNNGWRGLVAALIVVAALAGCSGGDSPNYALIAAQQNLDNVDGPIVMPMFTAGLKAAVSGTGGGLTKWLFDFSTDGLASFAMSKAAKGLGFGPEHKEAMEFATINAELANLQSEIDALTGQLDQLEKQFAAWAQQDDISQAKTDWTAIKTNYITLINTAYTTLTEVYPAATPEDLATTSVATRYVQNTTADMSVSVNKRIASRTLEI